MLGVRITTVMIAAQFLEVGLNTLIKAATTKGMSNFVYIVYSNALALCFLLPSTLFYHRNRTPPPVTISLICRMLLLSFLSCAVQTLMYTGIGYSSPTLSSAMVDLVPAYTSVLAIISRMENLDLKLQSSQAKIVGTVVSIAGALIVTLYKGLPLPITNGQDKVVGGTLLSQQSHWLLGGFLLAAASFCLSNGNPNWVLTLSLLLIVQTWIIKDYPAELMVTTICCGFVVILSAIVALLAEENPKSWVFRADMELVAIIYSAIFVVAMRSVVTAWACRVKGPVYAAMFNPLGIVIAFAMGVVFLGEALYLGSMVGAAIIAAGFYAVIWGKAQEEKMVNEKIEYCSFVSSSCATPLLQTRSMDV